MRSPAPERGPRNGRSTTKAHRRCVLMGPYLCDLYLSTRSRNVRRFHGINVSSSGRGLDPRSIRVERKAGWLLDIPTGGVARACPAHRRERRRCCWDAGPVILPVWSSCTTALPAGHGQPGAGTRVLAPGMVRPGCGGFGDGFASFGATECPPCGRDGVALGVKQARLHGRVGLGMPGGVFSADVRPFWPGRHAHFVAARWSLVAVEAPVARVAGRRRHLCRG